MQPLIAVLLALASGVQGAPPQQTDADREWLRGPVRTVVTERAGANGAAVPLSRETYDGTGRLVESVVYLRGEVDATSTYRVDEEGTRLERIVRPGGPRRTRLRPLAAKRPEAVFDAEGAEVRAHAMTYNSAGRLIGVMTYPGESIRGVSPIARLQIRPDRNGRPMEIISYGGWPIRITGRRTFVHGPDGLPTESVQYGPNNLDPRKSTYEYTLDERGNWTERRETRLEEGVAATEVLRRKITYAAE